VRDSILADFNYAIDKLPRRVPELVVVVNPALAFRGKLNSFLGMLEKEWLARVGRFSTKFSEATAALYFALQISTSELRLWIIPL
jgi:hypothetical protein